MLLYSFGLSVSYMGVIGTEVAVLARLGLAEHFGQARREGRTATGCGHHQKPVLRGGRIDHIG